MKNIWNLFIIQNKLYYREKQAVFWNFLFPVFIIVFFGLIFGEGNGIENLKLSVGLVDRDHTESSEPFINALKNIPLFEVREDDYAELEGKLKTGDLNYILIIPESFKTGENSYKPIELKYDPNQLNINQISFSIFDQIINQMNVMISGEQPRLSITKTAVQAKHEEFRYIDWFVPGILSMSLLASALFGVGVTIADEREKGQLRRFAVAPVSKAAYISSQIMQRFLVSIIQALVIIFLSLILFGVKMRGNWFLLLLVLSFGLLTFSALGYALAARIRKAHTVSAIANIIFMPMMFLSGVYFPVEIMPEYLRPVSKALPLTYLNEIVRLVFNGNETLAAVIVPVAVLTVWLIVCFLISVFTFIWD